MAEATKTTTPRKRAPRKAANATSTSAPEATEMTRTKVDRVVVEFTYDSDTKSYAKFVAPESMKGTVVGQVYAPLGTSRVKVAMFSADSDGEGDPE